MSDEKKPIPPEFLYLPVRDGADATTAASHTLGFADVFLEAEELVVDGESVFIAQYRFNGFLRVTNGTTVTDA